MPSTTSLLHHQASVIAPSMSSCVVMSSSSALLPPQVAEISLLPEQEAQPEALPDGWNDDAGIIVAPVIVAPNTNTVSNEMICLDEVSGSSRERALSRGRLPGFTWTSEDRSPRAKSPAVPRSHSQQPGLSTAFTQPRLVWAAAPSPDAVTAPVSQADSLIAQQQALQKELDALSLALQGDVSSTGAMKALAAVASSRAEDLLANKPDLDSASQLLDAAAAQVLALQSKACEELPEEECADLRNACQADEDVHTQGLALEAPSEFTVHVERHYDDYPEVKGCNIKIDDLVNEAANLDAEALLSRSSAFDFARLLLDSVRKRCSAHTASMKAMATPTRKMVAGTAGGSAMLAQAKWTENDDEFARDPCIGSQGTIAWGSADDIHRDEVECRTVIENLFFDSIPRQHVMILGIENVANPVASKRFLQHIKEENLHVGVTFHGAQPEHVEGIMREGILPEDWQANIGAHAGLAHLHAEADQRGRRFLCVLLTAISHAAGDQRQPRSGSPKLGEVNAMDRLTNQTYYGPVGEDRILVSHIITYGVCGGNRKRLGGGGFDDPFLRRLNSAVQRTGSVPAQDQRSNMSSSRPRLRRARQ